MKASNYGIKYVTFEELLEKNGYFAYTNEGYSMLPLIRQKRDIVEIHKKGAERCNRYDVVLYKRGNHYLLHRVLEVLPNGKYVIAGDNNTFLEKDISDDQIIGVMTRIIRNGKSIYMDDKLYKAYVHIWCDIYPVRIIILKINNIVKEGLYRVKKRLF